MVDHVGIYGSKGAEGLSAFNAGLVYIAILSISVLGRKLTANLSVSDSANILKFS